MPETPQSSPEGKREPSASFDVHDVQDRAREKQHQVVQELDRAKQTLKNTEKLNAPESSPEEIKTKHLALLKAYSALPREQFLEKLTSELIQHHSRNGTLHILFMAIDSHGTESAFSTNLQDPMQGYETAMENFVKEGLELKKMVQEIENVTRPAVLQRLSNSYARYFTQGKEGTHAMPRFKVNASAMSDEQLKTLLAVCILEEHVRKAGIEYNSATGNNFSTTTLPQKMNIPRCGDCNAIANYYMALASFSGSPTLRDAVGLIAVQGHAQLCFDLGKNTRGDRLVFSKNTSYVDMSQVDEKGRQKEGEPYMHNFYDFSHDVMTQGIDPQVNLTKPERFVASELGEIDSKGVFAEMTTRQLEQDLALQKKILELSPYSPTTSANAMETLFTLKDRKVITESDAKKTATTIMKSYIDASYFSAFDLANFLKEFGRDEAADLIRQYDQKIVKSGDGFRTFMLSALEGVPAGGDNVDIRNRRSILQLVKQMSQNEKNRALCEELLEKFPKTNN